MYYESPSHAVSSVYICAVCYRAMILTLVCTEGVDFETV